jgi:hypothetical protein
MQRHPQLPANDHRSTQTPFDARTSYGGGRGLCQLADGRTAQPEAFATVAVSEHRVTPFTVLQVPGDGRPKSLVEVTHRAPTELRPEPGRIDRVSAVVAWPIGNE